MFFNVKGLIYLIGIDCNIISLDYRVVTIYSLFTQKKDTQNKSITLYDFFTEHLYNLTLL